MPKVFAEPDAGVGVVDQAATTDKGVTPAKATDKGVLPAAPESKATPAALAALVALASEAEAASEADAAPKAGAAPEAGAALDAGASPEAAPALEAAPAAPAASAAPAAPEKEKEHEKEKELEQENTVQIRFEEHPFGPDALKHLGSLCPTITNKYYLLAGLDTLSMGMHMPGCFITIAFLRPPNKTDPALMFVFDLGTTTRAEGGILIIPIDDSGPQPQMGGRVFDVKRFKTYVPWLPDKNIVGGERPKRKCAEKHKSLVLAAWQAAVKDDTIMQKLIAAASSIS
jgi:hypothetical protein